jgi:hypothetical protein
VHEGGYGVAATDDGVFVFTRPDGRGVEANGAQCFSGNIARRTPEEYLGFEQTLRLHVLNREAGLRITPQTSRCQWRGERMDYSTAIEACSSWRNGPARRRPASGGGGASRAPSSGVRSPL